MAYSSYRSSGPGGSPRAAMVRLERPLSLGSGVKQAASATPAAPPPRPKAISPTLSQGRRASRNGRDDNGVAGRVRVAVRLRP
eukprot:c14506_g2_i2 orf=1-246(-)